MNECICCAVELEGDVESRVWDGEADEVVVKVKVSGPVLVNARM
jgi:hypothetical protein